MSRRRALEGMGRRRRTNSGTPTPVSRGNAGQIDVREVETTVQPQTRDIEVGKFLHGCGSQVKARGHRHGYFHVSDLAYGCQRKLALIYHFGGYHVSELLWPISDITFTIGDAIHDLVIEKYKFGSPDKIYGNWTCTCKQTTVTGVYDEVKETCNSCGTSTETYSEVQLLDEEHYTTASMDLIRRDIVDEEEIFTIGEIKSCSASIFDEIKGANRPKPDHLLQASFYHRMLSINGFTVNQKVHIIYVCKENRFGQAYQEFVVDPVPQHVNPILDRTREILNGGIPERISSCSAYGEGDSKRCGCAAVCFTIGSDAKNIGEV